MISSTSACGAMLTKQQGRPLLIGVMLAGIGTTALSLPNENVARPPLAALRTSAGSSVALAASAGSEIAELRRVSGFTWEQLSRLLGVSRRSVHFWASGKAMTSVHEEHLQRLLGVIRRVDRGSPTVTRAAIFAANEAGTIPFDLLIAKRYEDAVSQVGIGVEPRR
ncbi:MAG TPA: hypothetical protein VK745_14415, partial [Polyangiaceae bacterium]|nr:hypothetical protein [Polyangiaceae bacterium]